jgi:nucleotide-binding universal stress UspA family protein
VPTSIADLKAKLIRQAQHNVDRFLAPELEGLAVKRILLDGDPAQMILETARHQNVDLIMMPTHGYGAFRRFLVGSVTAKVLHDGECPVWTGAHLDAVPSQEFAIGHVLCAIDLSSHSPRLHQAAKQVQADLLVAGRPSGGRLRSTGYGITRESCVPVLSV